MRTTLLFLAIACTGCATGGDRITTEQMAPRMNHQGFSIARPASPRWFILKIEDHPGDVTLRWDLHSPTHTFSMRAALGTLDEQPKSHEEFARLAHPRPQEADEVRELSRTDKMVTIDGHWCVRIDSVDVVHPKGTIPELHLARHGYRCLHPSIPKQTVDFHYDERGLPSEFSPILTRDGDQFLAGVRIEAVAADVGPQGN